MNRETLDAFGESGRLIVNAIIKAFGLPEDILRGATMPEPINDPVERDLRWNLDEGPWLTINAWADHLADQGQEWLAKGMRWLADNRKWPGQIANRYRWVRHDEKRWGEGNQAGFALPPEIHARIPFVVRKEIGCEVGQCRTLSEAILTAAKAVAEWMQRAEVPPAAPKNTAMQMTGVVLDANRRRGQVGIAEMRQAFNDKED